MRQTVRLVRIAGIPVGAHWSVVVILTLITQVLVVAVLPAAGPPGAARWAAAAGFAALLLATIVVHELAHALTARAFGVRVRSITLWALGGVAELDGEPPSPRADLLVALAGPAASVAAAGACAAAAVLPGGAGAGPVLSAGLAWVAGISLVTAAFNLLPAAPLDGGRALAAVLWWRRGDRGAARRAAGRAGVATGWLLTAGAAAGVVVTGDPAWLWPAVIGWFLTTSARAEADSADLARACAGIRVDQVMSAPPVCGYLGQSVDGFLRTVAAHRPHDAYPVVDLEGRLAGLVRPARLLATPAAARAGTPLRQVVTLAARVARLTAQTPLLRAAAAIRDTGGPAVVLSDGRPVGVLSGSDVRRVTVLARLGVVPGRDDPVPR